ncbi:MAG: cupredoxin domain-containing protein [Alphaproteobacteria bacterium]|nr:cupredoxin domain-containing protein [Alphaproteobacteria bacterium]
MGTLSLAALGLVLATVSAAADAVVIQKSRAFRPANVTINPGERVTFTNDDSYIHQIYVDGLFDSDEKAPGENLNETFPRPGTFQVRCHIHPTMRMAVHVR